MSGRQIRRANCKRDPIIPLNSPRIQTWNTVIYICNIQITLWMLHTITKRLEICININIEISEADHYTWIFTSRIFRLALEITFLYNKYFFLQVAHKEREGWKIKKKISGGTLIRDLVVLDEWNWLWNILWLLEKETGLKQCGY